MFVAKKKRKLEYPDVGLDTLKKESAFSTLSLYFL